MDTIEIDKMKSKEKLKKLDAACDAARKAAYAAIDAAATARIYAATARKYNRATARKASYKASCKADAAWKIYTTKREAAKED